MNILVEKIKKKSILFKMILIVLLMAGILILSKNQLRDIPPVFKFKQEKVQIQPDEKLNLWNLLELRNIKKDSILFMIAPGHDDIYIKDGILTARKNTTSVVVYAVYNELKVQITVEIMKN